MAARAAEDWVENVVSNGWRATTLGQKRALVCDCFGVGYSSCEIPLESTSYWLHCAPRGWIHPTFAWVS